MGKKDKDFIIDEIEEGSPMIEFIHFLELNRPREESKKEDRFL